MYILIIILCIFLTITALISCVILLRKKRYCKFLINNSAAFKNLLNLNYKYKFYDIANFDETHIYDNSIFYTNVSCEDYLIYQLQFKKHNIENQIKFTNINKHNYFLYCQEVENIYKLGEYIGSHEKMNMKSLLAYERKLFEKNILNPTIEFHIHIKLYCSKINGAIYNSKHEKFSSEHILSLIKRLNNKNGSFYNDKDIWESICRVERGRVSNKMRFAIYKRDNYICQICGKGENFDNLEIDHIKPIAKGGKSVYSNLQTLCSRCNKEKGDKY